MRCRCYLPVLAEFTHSRLRGGRSLISESQISNLRFEIQSGEGGTRTRTGLTARRASNAVPYQLGDLSKNRKSEVGSRESGVSGDAALFFRLPTSDFRLPTSGGEGGIRTHGTLPGTTVFETARFSHSRTSPHVETCSSSRSRARARLPPTVSKERLHDRAGLGFFHARRDLDLMIQRTVSTDLKDRGDRTRLRVRRAVNQPL
jgi:hypothetical protein